MIDVPVLVKDALRDGRRLKNYRFMVLRKETTRTMSYMTIFTDTNRQYTVGRGEMLYVHVDASEPTGNVVGRVLFPNSSGYLPISIIHVSGSETFKALGQFLSGSVIDFSEYIGLTFPSIGLTSESLIRDETSWVDDFLIENDNLVTESVKIDERMASGNDLKFGLSEGASLEFQYFDKPNINGRKVRCEIEVQYEDTDNTLKWHTIPMGYFDVTQCPMQFDTGIRKVTAYNKLRSEYLDAKANTYIESMISDVGTDDEITIQTIMDLLLDDYKIEQQRDEIAVTALNQQTNDWTTYDDWTFKFVGQSTTRKVALGCTTKLMNENFYNGDGPEFLDDRLYFELDNYIQALEQNFFAFKNYVYENIQDPDAFMEKLRAKAPKELGLFIPSGGGTTSFRRYLISDVVPANNVVSQTIYAYPIEKLKYLQSIPHFIFHFLNMFGYTTSSTPTATWQYAVDFTLYNRPHIYRSDIDPVGTITVHRDKLQDVTLRDIISANYELKCQYGKLDRETDLFSGVNLNYRWLFPRENLYPANILYPGGGGLTSASGFKSTYQKLWTDSAGQQSFRNLIITYKGLDEEDKEKEFTVIQQVNPNGTKDYVIDDNWLFKNLIWDELVVYDYAEEMAAKLRDVYWIPYEMWAAGLPYVETGDEVEIIIGEDTYTSYVLQRQLSGIQNLQDTYINGTLDIF